MAAAILVFGGAATISLTEMTGTTNFFSTVGPGQSQDPANGTGGGAVEFKKVKWDSNDCGNCYKVDMQAQAPVASDFEADLFNAQPDEDGDYGNFVDYNRSKATNGMTQGVDYFHTDGTGTDTLTWSRSIDISSGTYDVAIDDDAATEEYHTLFTQVKIPETIRFTNYDNNRPIKIVGQSEFDRRADYDSDGYSLLNSNGNNVDFADKDGTKDLASSAYSSDDETFTVKRTLDYKHGKDYLGEVSLLSVNGTSQATVDLVVKGHTGEDTDGDGTVEQRETLFDQQLAQDGSSSDFDADLSDNIETAPVKVGSELVAEFKVNFDGTAVGTDWTVANATIKDSYGNNVGSSPYISLTS